MRTNDERGFTLIATGFCIASLLGMLGLSLDLGRVYIAKNETQTFVDTAALAAAMALNGADFNAARNAVTGNTKNQWNLGTSIFAESGNGTTVRTEFARPLPTDASRPDSNTWSPAPGSAAGYSFVRVKASAIVPLYILPVVGAAKGQLVEAAAVAGQVPMTSFASGLLPFSPIAHNGAAAAHPPFGLVVGKWYTLRYPGAAGFSNGDVCPGDQGDAAFLTLANRQPAAERGFYQDPQGPAVVKEIVDGAMPFPVVFPGAITMSGGPMNAAQHALNERIDFDTDRISATFAQYQANRSGGKRVGNGFRLVAAPVNAGPAAGESARDIVGIGGFFLSASSSNVHYTAGDKVPWCAEYYGVWNKAGQGAGPGKPGMAYTTVLVQ